MFGSSSSSSSFYPPSPAFGRPKSAAVTRVASMTSDAAARRWANDNGLAIMNVSWEDAARNKNSAYGPCISDMTLVVENTWMPVLRVPNFSDPIMSIPTSKIMVTVGNESPHNVPLTKISLHEYLDNIHKYTELERSLYAPAHDHQALVSTQACFLPIEEATGKAEFHVGLTNYQARENDPAVLVLVCTDTGTSAQVMTQRSATLFCNNKGSKHTFIAERLSTDRAKRGVATTGAMTEAEEARNYVMIIQIPLEQKPVSLRGDDGPW
ncbi:hypothetical protein SDRG_04995 [Saprolegnia diclina VS20]|uniref:Uncharacterized protein n=1 Tax=Saprolegnia diclina (strain VS20) TaxID=1156394 RepID=T0QRP9_SAPDV|nr:hypothetical protein SDRG_04995 [Saprolegnia diclina VS20]EQC37391.1 hypothetical protein SDRG_04995 [Saprolegnia diclina VS20]|eukprot:XP_008608911.1 hypothetical protein SDRG_04995 [Saprolegnia diclina VS20]